jgi:hypothetical protein
VETLTYSSGRASGCDSPGLLNSGATLSSPHGPCTILRSPADRGCAECVARTRHEPDRLLPMPEPRPALFKWRHFEPEIIVCAVRW